MRCGGSQRDTSSYRCETGRDSSEKSGDLYYDFDGATESVIAGSPTLLFAVELTILYAAGSYVMGRLIRISGFAGSGNVLGHLAFYLLVFPGVVLHEGAHYLACLLTRTRVARFAPFSPGRTSDGRIVLGTALLTPLTFREVANPSFGAWVNGIFAGGFLADTPLPAAVWAYLSLSFALGSVPSREDLAGLPLMLVVFGGGILLVGLLGIGTGSVHSSIYDLSALAAGLYALPATVAAVAALTLALAGRAVRR